MPGVQIYSRIALAVVTVCALGPIAEEAAGDDCLTAEPGVLVLNSSPRCAQALAGDTKLRQSLKAAIAAQDARPANQGSAKPVQVHPLQRLSERANWGQQGPTYYGQSANTTTR